MQVEDGWPILATDKGKGAIDEMQLLREAERISGAKLQYVSSRAERWRKAPLRSLFLRRDEMWMWSFATILRVACERCGQEPGVGWWQLPSGPPGWVGAECLRSLEAGEGWDD